MQIREREVGDRSKIEELITREKRADKRDRFRVVLLALRGHEKLEIPRLLGLGSV